MAEAKAHAWLRSDGGDAGSPVLHQGLVERRIVGLAKLLAHLQPPVPTRASRVGEAVMMSMFDELDTDNSDTLDAEEVHALCSKLGLALDDEGLVVAMEEMDEYGSGEVDFEEFSEWWAAGGLGASALRAFVEGQCARCGVAPPRAVALLQALEAMLASDPATIDRQPSVATSIGSSASGLGSPPAGSQVVGPEPEPEAGADLAAARSRRWPARVVPAATDSALRAAAQASHREAAANEPKVAHTSHREALADGPKVAHTSHREAAADELKVAVPTRKDSPPQPEPEPAPEAAPMPKTTVGSVNRAGGARRENCRYGASCYQRNPKHKARFAHPHDPDWDDSVGCD
jgi:hypothetical protein